jgi:hypothetical protein
MDFWYLYRHPITDAIYPVVQWFDWNATTGEWQLPAHQPSLPQMVEGTEFYWTQEEALAARSVHENTESLQEETEGSSERGGP